VSIELDDEDQKLVTLSRSMLARTSSGQAAAARDRSGRTYVAAAVDLPHLRLEALQAVVAALVSAGGEGIEAAAVIGWSPTPDGVAAVRDLDGQAPIYLIDSSGTATGRA
jgi:hypothetical protein